MNIKHLRSRIASYALIFADGHVLLTLLNRGTNTGKWTLPGGGLEWGETPEQALLREVFEETSLKLKDFKFLFHLSTTFELPEERIHTVRVIYVSHLERILPVKVELQGDSTTDVRWVNLDDLQNDGIHPVVIEAYGQWKKNHSTI